MFIHQYIKRRTIHDSLDYLEKTNYKGSAYISLEDAHNMTEQLPASDVAEIVKCENCINCDGCLIKQSLNAASVPDSRMFCGAGVERKEC